MSDKLESPKFTDKKYQDAFATAKRAIELEVLAIHRKNEFERNNPKYFPQNLSYFQQMLRFVPNVHKIRAVGTLIGGILDFADRRYGPEYIVEKYNQALKEYISQPPQLEEYALAHLKLVGFRACLNSLKLEVPSLYLADSSHGKGR